MDDDQILARGGTEREIRQSSEMNGADTPNTQGASWEEFDRLVKECENTAYLVSEENHPQSENDLARENLKAYFSKERAEGERQERERILAALPREYSYDDSSPEAAQRSIGWYQHLKKTREAITTLPADSTEV